MPRGGRSATRNCSPQPPAGQQAPTPTLSTRLRTPPAEPRNARSNLNQPTENRKMMSQCKLRTKAAYWVLAGRSLSRGPTHLPHRGTNWAAGCARAAQKKSSLSIPDEAGSPCGSCGAELRWAFDRAVGRASSSCTDGGAQPAAITSAGAAAPERPTAGRWSAADCRGSYVSRSR